MNDYNSNFRANKLLNIWKDNNIAKWFCYHTGNSLILDLLWELILEIILYYRSLCTIFELILSISVILFLNNSSKRIYLCLYEHVSPVVESQHTHSVVKIHSM